MDSASSTDDAIRQYDESQQNEVYHESEWHDRDCTAEFANQDQSLTSKLCNACQGLFSGLRETQRTYKHYYHSSALRFAAENGCQLCALVRSKTNRETKTHRPSEILRLEFTFYKGTVRGNVTEFELWFQYSRIPKNTKYTKEVWGVEIIDFLLSEGTSVSKYLRQIAELSFLMPWLYFRC